MTDLQEYRRQIDEIDAKIVELFETRMGISEKVAEYKIKTGRQVLDAGREAEKIEAVTRLADGPFNQTGVKELFRQIMAISRKKQYQVLTKSGVIPRSDFKVADSLPASGARVVFQGVEGAYSYAAMRQYFSRINSEASGNEITSFHVKTWKDAMEAVSRGEADYAVLPIENSTAGMVSDIYDLLMEYKLAIVGEHILPIDHVLLGLPQAELEDIRKVCSHPQGLAQCREYLEKHPQWETVQTLNTAQAAKMVEETGDPSLSAIASREAGELYGLKVLAEGLCPNQSNSTRFIIVSARLFYLKDAGTVSICFENRHTSGSLYNMLSHIIYNGLNMTRIESRPIPGKNWEYRFFVDFEGNLSESAVINALRGIGAEALTLRILGNY